MNIQFQSVNSYLRLNNTENRQQLLSELQGFQRQLQTRPDLQQTILQQPQGQAFLNALVNASKHQIATTDIQDIQHFLSAQGYDISTPRVPSGIDGKYGPKTHTALNQLMTQLMASAAPPAPSTDNMAPGMTPAPASALPTLPPEFSLYAEAPAPTAPESPAPTPSEPSPRRTQIAPALQGAAITSHSAERIDQWFLAQYDGQSDSPETDCGPATAAMILRANGLGANANLEQVRQWMGVSHNKATTAFEIARGIEAGSQGQLDTLVLQGAQHFPNDPAGFLEQIKSQLAAGREVILLTQNMATEENGHYVIIQGISAENELIVADPGSRDQGKNRVFSYQDFVQAYRQRERIGMPNDLISIRRKIRINPTQA